MDDEKSPAEYDRALAACEEALRLEPENESACLLRGAAYCWKRDYARAVSDFQKLGLPLPLKVPYGSRGEGITLQMAKQETGRLEPGDRLNITAANGEWLWVDSLELSSSSSPARQAQGWVHQRSVEPE